MLKGMQDYPSNLITCTHQQLSLSSFSKPFIQKTFRWNGLKKLNEEKMKNMIMGFFSFSLLL